MFGSVLRINPYVFRPPGSGSISTIYGSGSGSGSFYHQAKIIKKPWILLFCDSLWIFSLKTDVNVASKSKKQKNLEFFLLPSRRSLTKIAGSGSISQRYPNVRDPYYNVRDPQHWFGCLYLTRFQNLESSAELAVFCQQASENIIILHVFLKHTILERLCPEINIFWKFFKIKSLLSVRALMVKILWLPFRGDN